MNTCPLFLLFLLTCSLTAEKAPDFLRFKNGDTLHGQYQGLDEGPLVKWLSSESVDSIHFETQNLRKLSLNHGRSEKQLTSKGLIYLSNGDQILGSLIAMGADSVSLQTEFAGLLTIPRKYVTKISPNRHGVNSSYAGPFNNQGWQTPGKEITSLDKDKEPKVAEEAEPEPEVVEEPELAEEEIKVPPPPKGWVYAGGAWYSHSSDVLRLNTELPDQVSIRFQLSWQASLNASFAVFSDFQRPHREPQARVRRVPEGPEKGELDEEPAEEPAEAEEPAFLDIMEVGPGSADSDRYGSGYLVTVLSSYSRLYRLGFDDKLREKKSSFPNSGGRLNLSDLYTAEFEIRADREKGALSLFVNGTFYSEWQDLADPLEKVGRYFAISAGAKSKLRISDVVISEWNGMPDSARSMETEERDVLLLANGLDRYSGKILTLEEGMFRMESDYGIFQIPLDEVTDIQLASDDVEEAPAAEDGQILVNFQPKGRLSFLPKEGLSNSLQGEHAILGELSLDLSYAYLLEFDPIGSIFDNWDDEF